MRLLGCTSRRELRGASLVLFAVLVFALMASAAVAIDVGLAGLSQAQMQGAVDTAALEGQRWRQYAEFQNDSDRNRRLKSIEMASLVFDDDLDPTNGDPMGFGAGPVLELTPNGGGGQPLLQIPKNSVYKPDLQPNWGDLQFGDMVSGSFDIGPPGVEGADYARADLTPSTNAIERWLGDGFLVRMRRSSVPYPNDEFPLKSSRGPGVPILFGLGAPISAGAGSSYDPRAHGLTVRATAVAAALPALSVGDTPRDLDGNLIPQSPGDVLNYYNHLGVTPFAVSLEFWNRYTLDDPACVVADVMTDTQGNTRGRLRIFDEDLQAVGETIGWFVDGMRQIGDALVPAPPPAAPAALAPRLDGFIPIYADIDGTSRVVGFGHGVLWDPSFSASEQCQSTIGVMKTISKFDTRLPLTGSSALLLYPADSLSADEWRLVFNLNRNHFTTDRLDASILAPALAR